MSSGSWNPALYEARHSFVWERGRDLLALLAPQQGWRILDVGCGTGQLTAEIARSGASVLGIDNSPAMIARARANFPGLEFEIADVTALAFGEEFDAVFSNAALHWVTNAGAAARSMACALKHGGRLVAELGGRGNIRCLLEALHGALESMGAARLSESPPYFFPGIAEYAAILEEHGLEVTWAALFDRPTILEGGEDGLAAWLEMFGGWCLEALDPAGRAELLRRLKERAAPTLFRGGAWTVDYRRLRLVAVRT
jgi:trans-aconitate 2-methyltransferase